MARPRAACGTYPAYRRHLREHEPIDAACRAAQKDHDRSRSTSADARRARAAAGEAPLPARKLRAPRKPVLPEVPEVTGDAEAVPDPDDGKSSRIEVLQGMLAESRANVRILMATDPGRVYLQMREQRDILRELAELQGNGQSKGVTLADQLAAAREARRAAAAARSASA